MDNLRIWHASRDPYHCAFRYLRLLLAETGSIEIERLRILDMFLLYPSLLHRTSMPKDVKDSFRKLGIEKPEDIFMRLPSPASVFQDLRVYQNSAIAHLAARGLITAENLKRGAAKISQVNIPATLLGKAMAKNQDDGGLTAFLVGQFSTIPLRGSDSIYRKAGLPTRAIAA